MDVKEAIELVCVGRERYLTFNECHKVVDCLRRGEKYEQIVKEFSKKYGNNYYAYDVRGSLCKKHEYIETLLNNIEQRYFPKGSNNG